MIRGVFKSIKRPLQLIVAFKEKHVSLHIGLSVIFGFNITRFQAFTLSLIAPARRIHLAQLDQFPITYMVYIAGSILGKSCKIKKKEEERKKINLITCIATGSTCDKDAYRNCY